MNRIFTSTIKDTLDEADSKFKEKCLFIDKELDKIVKGICHVNSWNSLWPFVGVGLGMFLSMISFVLWPTDNVFLNPEAWWKFMLQCGLVWTRKCDKFHSMVFHQNFPESKSSKLQSRVSILHYICWLVFNQKLKLA